MGSKLAARFRCCGGTAWQANVGQEDVKLSATLNRTVDRLAASRLFAVLHNLQHRRGVRDEKERDIHELSKRGEIPAGST